MGTARDAQSRSDPPRRGPPDESDGRGRPGHDGGYAPKPPARPASLPVLNDTKPHVVIVGSGFGGLYATKALARAPVQVTLLDRKNHHTFQPLLYQVATAGLNPSEIAIPIRRILRHQKNAAVLLAEVEGIDPDGKV